MKKSLLLYFLFFGIASFCQVKLSDVPLDLKKNPDFHQIASNVNPKTNEIYIFAADKEKIFGARFNNSIFFRDSLTVKKPFNFRTLLGISYLENNNPVVYFATEDLSRVVAVEYNFAAKTNPIKDLGLNLKEETIYTEFSKNGNFYFITKSKNENDLQLIKLEGNSILKKQLAFESFSLEINSVKKPTLTNVLDEFGLTKIESKGFNSIFDTSQKVKYYIKNNKLFITFDHALALTSIYEIDLNTFSIEKTVFKNSNLPVVKRSNSLLFENNLITMSANSSAMEIQFIKYQNKSSIKNYTIDIVHPSPFTNPFYKIIGNGSPATIKTAKKFIQNILYSDLGMSIYNFKGKYLASFGGLQYRSNSNDVFSELVAMQNFSRGNSGDYTVQQSMVDVVFDSAFKQIEPIKQPLFIDKIAQFKSENQNIKYSYYFPFKNFYILSYYDPVAKQIVLRKFIDGFDY